MADGADPDEVTLSMARSGPTGLPVVLVHGWLCDRADMAALHSILAQTYDVISVDLRGHGHSPRPSQGYSLAQLADDVAAVLRRLELRPALVVGHSLGGAVALELACRSPQRVAGVVMIDAPWALIPPGPEVVASAAHLDGAKLRSRRLAIEQARVAAGSIVDRDLAASEAGGAQTFASLMAWPGPRRLADCRVPLHAIFGDGSWSQVRAATGQYVNLQSAHVSGTGHWVGVQAPSEIADLIMAFADVALNTY